MSGYIFDTNIFNRILDGQFDLNSISGEVKLFATHIELDEIRNTRNCERRSQLLSVFEAIDSKKIPTESAVWDVSNWDEAKWTVDDNLYEPIVKALDAKNGGKGNNVQDALIAETAIRNNLTLVTEDGDLAIIARGNGGNVIDFVKGMKLIGAKQANN